MNLYLNLLNKKPFIIRIGVSSLILTTGDIISQRFIEKSN